MSNFQLPDSPDDEFKLSSDMLRSVEAAIRASGNYVVPSDNLRPRTLEAAREYCQDRSGNRKFGKSVLLVLLCCSTSIVLANRLAAWREKSAMPTTVEIQEHALELASDTNIGRHWGMLEAFIQLRQDQAARLGQNPVTERKGSSE